MVREVIEKNADGNKIEFAAYLIFARTRMQQEFLADSIKVSKGGWDRVEGWERFYHTFTTGG